jgi:hypothetical protein
MNRDVAVVVDEPELLELVHEKFTRERVVPTITPPPRSAINNGITRCGSLKASAQNAALHSGIASSRRSTIGMYQTHILRRISTTSLAERPSWWNGQNCSLEGSPVLSRQNDC